MASSIPHLHPAVPVTAHLWPGIKDWAASASEYIAHFSADKLSTSNLNLSTLESWYIHTDPLYSALTFCTGLSLFTFVVGQLTRNASTVDRMWAALPVVYSAHFALHGHWGGAASISKLFSWSGVQSKWKSIVPAGVDERMFLVLLLQMAWSTRLTGNTLRRGFFNPLEEDYRWPIVRKRLTKWQWVLLDFVFVSFIQNFLLLATALPQYLLLTSTRSYHPINPATPLGWPDFAIAGLFLLNLAVEQTADSQQQRFQNWKHGPGLKEGKGSRQLAGKSQKQIEKAEGDLRRGFLTNGLWGWSRHPNFLCEQLNFWILPLFTLRATVPESVFESLIDSVKTGYYLKDVTYFTDALRAASSHIFNYTWGISIAMTLLFISSTTLTEAISAGKYPLYKEYQRRVGMFLPGTTILKGIWLGVTGQLSKVNDNVYGYSKSKKN